MLYLQFRVYRFSKQNKGYSGIVDRSKKKCLFETSNYHGYSLLLCCWEGGSLVAGHNVDID